MTVRSVGIPASLLPGSGIPDLAFIRQDADFTLTSQTAAQALFNTTTNGRITLTTGVYKVIGAFFVNNMSATSGNADFNILGAGGATLGGQMFVITGRDGSADVAGSTSSASGIQAQNNVGGDIVAAAVTTTMFFSVVGMFKVTVAGTVVPSIALTTASAAVVKVGSYLIIEKLAALGNNSKGSWD